MKQVIYLILLVLPLTLRAAGGETPESHRPVPNGHWEKVSVKGVRHNITAPGQNKVIAFECIKPFDNECLFYYKWVQDGHAPFAPPNPGTAQSCHPIATLPIQMNENLTYLGLPDNGAVSVFEQETATIDISDPAKVRVTIAPGIDLP